MVSAISDNSKVLPRLQLAVLEQEEVEKMQTLKFKLNPSGRKRRTLLNMMVTQTSLIDKVLSKLLLDEINGDLSRATAFNIQKRFSTKKSPEYVGNDFKQAFVESAVIKASQSWISYTSRKYPIDKETGDPQNILINEPMLYLRTRQVEFLKTERGSYVVGIRLPKGKIGETLVIPTDGHQYDGTIEEIMNATDRWSEKNANEFTAEIKTYGDDIYLNVMCDFKKPVIDYEPENMIGVDIGQVNIATIAVISKDENLQKAKFFNGRKIYRLIDRMEHRNDKLKSNDKEPTNVSEFKKTVSHQVSRAVIEFAKTFPKPIIVAEDLKNMPRGRFGRRMNRRMSKFDYNRFLGMLEYKCENEGIRFIKVPPRGTSSICPKCGSPVKRNRKIHESVCSMCEYTLNDDLLGAYNIAIRGCASLQRVYKHPRNNHGQVNNLDVPTGHASLGEASSNASGCINAMHPEG